jgi:cell wall-associated NlpC family hydrolase
LLNLSSVWCVLYICSPGPDILNGANWGSGYTGTLLQHGRSVPCPGQIGDLIIYGNPGSTGDHVVVYVGGGYTIGHGEPGLDRNPWQNGPAPVQSCRSYLD